jgi:hypothetical protein
MGSWRPVQLVASSVADCDGPRTRVYISLVPQHPGERRRPASIPKPFRRRFPSSLGHYSAIQQHDITCNTMVTVSLDNQSFYTGPAAANSKSTNHSLLAQNSPSSGASGTPLHSPHPRPLQDAGGSQPGSTKMQPKVIDIPSDEESDHDNLEVALSYQTHKRKRVAWTGTGLKSSPWTRLPC